MEMTLVEDNNLLQRLELQVRPTIAPMQAEAEAIQIVDQPTYDLACDIARRAVDARKLIKARLEPGKSAARSAWREWVDLENEMLSLVTGAEGIAKKKIGAWNDEQERLRREEEARLQEIARKEEEEARLQEAVAVESDGGSEEEVEAIMQEPPAPVAVIAPPTFKKSQGVSSRANWKGEVTHLPTLIQYVAKNPQFSNLLKVDTTALNALVRSQKELFKMPGAKAVKVTNVAIK